MEEKPKVIQRYTLLHASQAITCHTCNNTSYNRNDYRYHYCGWCKKFLDD